MGNLQRWWIWYRTMLSSPVKWRHWKWCGQDHSSRHSLTTNMANYIFFSWWCACLYVYSHSFFLTASKRLALAVLVVALLHLVTLWFCLIIMTQYLATYCRLSQQYCWLRLSNASLSQYCQHDSVMPPRLSNAGNNVSALFCIMRCFFWVFFNCCEIVVN